MTGFGFQSQSEISSKGTVFLPQHDPVAEAPGGCDNAVGPRIFLSSCAKLYPLATF